MENYTENKYLETKRRVKKIKGFYLHLFIFILVNLANIFFKIKGDHHIKISQFLTIVIWGSILLIHGIKVFMPNFILGKNWEEKKIKELMDNEKNKNIHN